MGSGMNEAIIRPLQIEDAEEIGGIYKAITQQPVQEDFKLLLQEHAQREEDACFVAEIDGKVVGFMISYILTLGFGIDKSAWIATLGVSPDHMGEGIGSIMAEEIMKFYKSRGISRVYTSVRWDSSDMLSFFKTLGFTRSNHINLRKAIP